jgi:hypothetical protein
MPIRQAAVFYDNLSRQSEKAFLPLLDMLQFQSQFLIIYVSLAIPVRLLQQDFLRQ